MPELNSIEALRSVDLWIAWRDVRAHGDRRSPRATSGGTVEVTARRWSYLYSNSAIFAVNTLNSSSGMFGQTGRTRSRTFSKISSRVRVIGA